MILKDGLQDQIRIESNDKDEASFEPLVLLYQVLKTF